jgi:hypothetical protein
MVEGFWTVQFQGIQGWGSGVLTLIGETLFGGDTSFLYTGTYAVENVPQPSAGETRIHASSQDAIRARVHVKRYAPGLPNVMGRDEFDLELNGTVQGKSANVIGTVPGTQLRLAGTLTKQDELPKPAMAA